MAKDREIVCKYYLYEGSCSKGREGTFRHKCQTCNLYEPKKGTVPAQIKNGLSGSTWAFFRFAWGGNDDSAGSTKAGGAESFLGKGKGNASHLSGAVQNVMGN